MYIEACALKLYAWLRMSTCVGIRMYTRIQNKVAKGARAVDVRGGGGGQRQPLSPRATHPRSGKIVAMLRLHAHVSHDKIGLNVHDFVCIQELSIPVDVLLNGH